MSVVHHKHTHEEQMFCPSNNSCSSDQRCFVNTLQGGQMQPTATRCALSTAVCMLGLALHSAGMAAGALGAARRAVLMLLWLLQIPGEQGAAGGAVVAVSRATSSSVAPGAGWPCLRGSHPRAEPGSCPRACTLRVLPCSPQQLLLHGTMGCFWAIFTSLK